MKNHKLFFFTTILFSLLTQGCGTDKKVEISSPKAIGEGVSIITDKPNSEMAPSKYALKSVSNQIGNIIKIHIDELNNKEAISFDKETNYCDISGLKESEHLGNMKEITIKRTYKTCKNEHTLQNGEIKVTFKKVNEEGKLPQSVEFIVPNGYQFNQLTLNNDIQVMSADINYNQDNSLKSLTLKINGTLYHYTQKIELTNYSHQVLF